jgi:hypothetical protein
MVRRLFKMTLLQLQRLFNQLRWDDYVESTGENQGEGKCGIFQGVSQNLLEGTEEKHKHIRIADALDKIKAGTFR